MYCMNDQIKRLLVLSLHELSVGMRIFECSDNVLEFKLQESVFSNAVMNLMGFTDSDQYTNSYPGKCNLNSRAAHKIEGYCETEEVLEAVYSFYFYEMEICNGIIFDILESCVERVKNSIIYGGNFGSIVLFPTIKEFCGLVPDDQLWFCLDWKES